METVLRKGVILGLLVLLGVGSVAATDTVCKDNPRYPAECTRSLAEVCKDPDLASTRCPKSCGFCECIDHPTYVGECNPHNLDGLCVQISLAKTRCPKSCGICVVDCHTPKQSIANAAVNGTATTYQSNWTFACDTGYTSLGGGVITCQDNGSWTTADLSCTVVNCGTPNQKIDNATITGTDTTYTKTQTFACNTGYTSKGSGEITCQASGTWTTADLVCTVVDCAAPTQTIAQAEVTGNGTTYLSTQNFTCSTGYIGTGDASITCQADGTWKPADLVCSAVDCHTPNQAIDHATISVGKTTYQSQLIFTCDTGYTGAGEDTIICQPHGHWSTSHLICTVVDCGTPIQKVADATLSGSGITYKSTHTFNCNAGYTGTGNGVITCTATKTWTSSQLTCAVVDCGTPKQSIDNASITGKGTTYQSSQTFGCNSGYVTSTGSGAITCQAGGTWSTSKMACTAVSCGKPTQAIANASLTGAGITYPSKQTFSCNPGFTSKGNGDITCKTDKTWTTSNLKCTAIGTTSSLPLSTSTPVIPDTSTVPTPSLATSVTVSHTVAATSMTMSVVPTPSSSLPTPTSSILTSSTSNTGSVPKAKREVGGSRFDTPSFLGGIILCGGLIAVIFFGIKFIKAKRELSRFRNRETVL